RRYSVPRGLHQAITRSAGSECTESRVCLTDNWLVYTPIRAAGRCQNANSRQEGNRIWQHPISSGRAAASAGPHGATRGGFHLYWFFSAWAASLCTPTGPPGKTTTIPTGLTSLRFIPRSSLGTLPMHGSALSLRGIPP